MQLMHLQQLRERRKNLIYDLLCRCIAVFINTLLRLSMLLRNSIILVSILRCLLCMC